MWPSVATGLEPNKNMDIPLKKYYLQTMELDLNQYVRTTTNKVLTPLLKENNCGDLKPQQQSWLFNLEKATPDKNEWSRLMSPIQLFPYMES